MFRCEINRPYNVDEAYWCRDEISAKSGVPHTIERVNSQKFVVTKYEGPFDHCNIGELCSEEGATLGKFMLERERHAPFIVYRPHHYNPNAFSIRLFTECAPDQEFYDEPLAKECARELTNATSDCYTTEKVPGSFLSKTIVAKLSSEFCNKEARTNEVMQGCRKDAITTDPVWAKECARQLERTEFQPYKLVRTDYDSQIHVVEFEDCILTGHFDRYEDAIGCKESMENIAGRPLEEIRVGLGHCSDMTGMSWRCGYDIYFYNGRRFKHFIFLNMLEKYRFLY